VPPDNDRTAISSSAELAEEDDTAPVTIMEDPSTLPVRLVAMGSNIPVTSFAPTPIINPTWGSLLNSVSKNSLSWIDPFITGLLDISLRADSRWALTRG